MAEKLNHSRKNRHEHTVPYFWPLAAAIELGEQGMRKFQDNLRYLAEAADVVAPPTPKWATANSIALDLDTMRLRDFTLHGSRADTLPVLIDAPFAGHSSTIADFAHGQSLVGTMHAAGHRNVFVTDWKSATSPMKFFDIDKYLAEINVVVDELGGLVNLVGLCQGGWMSAMYAARFPGKVNSLVLAGSPIDTQAGDGPLKKISEQLPLSFYQELLASGGGLMRGQIMLAGWKDMHPEQQYFGKYLDLYAHIEDKNYIRRTETFEQWYENPIDLPGNYYLQAIEQLFKQNRFARGQFIGLGRTLSLKDIHCPIYLLAGENDDITPKEQVFAAAQLVGTPNDMIVQKLAPGGHIGLFMGTKTLQEYWPLIAAWMLQIGTRKTAANAE